MSAQPLRTSQRTTMLFQRCVSKYISLYRLTDLPRRCPQSIQYICAHRSIRPFGAGVPVRPITRSTVGAAIRIALNLWLFALLKLVSSSIIKASNGSWPPYFPTSHTKLSLPVTYTSAFCDSATQRCFSVLSTFTTLSPCRWSHFWASVFHVVSATFLGATTKTRSTSPSSISCCTAVRVETVLPSPISRNRPQRGDRKS